MQNNPRIETLPVIVNTWCLTPYLDGSPEITWGKSNLGGLTTFGAIAVAQTFVFECEPDQVDNSRQAIFVKVASKKAYRVSFPIGEETDIKSDRLVRAIAVF